MVGGSETCSPQPPETLTSSTGEGKLHPALEQGDIWINEILLYYHYHSMLRTAKWKDNEKESHISGDKLYAVTRTLHILSVAVRQEDGGGHVPAWAQRRTRPQPGSHCISTKRDTTLNFPVPCSPPQPGLHQLPDLCAKEKAIVALAIAQLHTATCAHDPHSSHKEVCAYMQSTAWVRDLATPYGYSPCTQLRYGNVCALPSLCPSM